MKSNNVVITPPRFKENHKARASWKNLKRSANFKLVVSSWGPLARWSGKCSLAATDDGRNSVLTVWILPNPLVIVMLAIMVGLVTHAIITFAIANHGTSGFWPSTIMPSFLTMIPITAWLLLARHAALSIRNDVVESFKPVIAVI